MIPIIPDDGVVDIVDPTNLTPEAVVDLTEESEDEEEDEEVVPEGEIIF